MDLYGVLFIITLMIFLPERYQEYVYLKLGYYRYLIFLGLFLALIATLVSNEFFVFIPMAIILSCLVAFLDFRSFKKFMNRNE
ncbi:hypothetical protein [Latilactobacillus sakei]|uniref:hypothetical protein n=1 Tax=Latilactobacillus sakei TaxID=1599 RepID=UPI000DC64881|nr:hypothetical protein [Latilactobacillus sakei]SPS04013.1 hypothetical protein LAS9624_00845 [Latilactobacillus sakei]